MERGGRGRGGSSIKSECGERKREGSLCPNAAQAWRVSCSGLRPALACEREGGRGGVGGEFVAVQKVKERRSCPMRDNKNRPHRPLWCSCSPPGLGWAGPGWARPSQHRPPQPLHQPPPSPDHFHKPDATGAMTVDHKLLAREKKKSRAGSCGSHGGNFKLRHHYHPPLPPTVTPAVPPAPLFLPRPPPLPFPFSHGQ